MTLSQEAAPVRVTVPRAAYSDAAIRMAASVLIHEVEVDILDTCADSYTVALQPLLKTLDRRQTERLFWRELLAASVHLRTRTEAAGVMRLLTLSADSIHSEAQERRLEHRRAMAKEEPSLHTEPPVPQVDIPGCRIVRVDAEAGIAHLQLNPLRYGVPDVLRLAYGMRDVAMVQVRPGGRMHAVEIRARVAGEIPAILEAFTLALRDLDLKSDEKVEGTPVRLEEK